MSGLTAALQLDKGDFSLNAKLMVPAKGVTALFGASGAGKTHLLRCIAGLESQAQGLIQVDEVCWQDTERHIFLPPHQRALGYVFQGSALFPHMNVQDNINYGYKRTSCLLYTSPSPRDS